MKKLLFLLAVLTVGSLGDSTRAQGWGYPYYSGSYSNSFSGYNDWASYSYFNRYATPSEKAAFGINQFFNTLGSTLYLVEEHRAIENEIYQRRNALENAKSIQRFYTEGVPPFANIAPDGKPRSPKITWKDVQAIE